VLFRGKHNDPRGDSADSGVCRNRREVSGTATAFRSRYLDKCVFNNPALRSPAPEILAHLAKKPQAQDTLAGIQWGVLHACIGDLAANVSHTVADLVERGYLEKTRPSSDDEGDKEFYRVSARYLSTLQQDPRVNGNSDDDE
jgi:hypothetical protein